jgi:hypothetical protein
MQVSSPSKSEVKVQVTMLALFGIRQGHPGRDSKEAIKPDGGPTTEIDCSSL